MTSTSPVVQLVAPNLRFAEEFFRWRSEPRTLKYNPVRTLSVKELQKAFALYGSELSKIEEIETFRWFVEWQGKIVGTVSLDDINLRMGFAEIGYIIGESYHRKGFGGAAVRALINKVFDETPLRKLMAHVHERNAPSCKLLERLGFKKEGLLKEHFMINGKPTNQILYGLLRSSWRN